MNPARRPPVAAVVLAYHPDADIVENLRALSAQVGRIYVVNNSPGADAVLASLRRDPGVTILDQHENVGVAAGFNAGMRAALADGFDFVWLFDQDSTVTGGMLDRLLDAHAALGPRAGIVAPALRSHATGVIYARESGRGLRDADVLISSGSLFSRTLIEAIGLHDEPLFIDYVDHDICLRAKRRGFRNVKVFDAILDHRFGDSDPIRLWGRRVYLANYSTTRHFYAARNRLIVLRRNGFGRWFWADVWFTAKAWIKLVLAERDRGAKIRAAARGIVAGVRYPARELHW